MRRSAAGVGMTRQRVIAWRARYAAGGIAALPDPPRSGRPQVIDEVAVVVATLNPPGSSWRSRTGRHGCWPTS
jgi:hypothetical protein